MKNLVKNILSGSIGGFLAGICISIGGCVYLAANNKVVGSILFCVALLTICSLELNLYTGRIGSIVNDHRLRKVGWIFWGLLGNLVATSLCGYATSVLRPDLMAEAARMCDGKMLLSWQSVLFRGIMCGILMFIAVHMYNRQGSIVGILFCIPTFIIAGFEHSIADAFYFAASGVVNWDVVAFLGIVILGNSIGAILFAAMCKLYTKI